MGGQELKMNLDGDEAMAMGAVFKAANMSTNFRPRPFGIIDVTRHPVDVHIFEEPEADESGEPGELTFSKKASIFKQYNKLGKKKSVALTHDKDFQVELMHAEPDSLPEGVSELIGSYDIEGVADVMVDEKWERFTVEAPPRVTLSFLLDYSGLVSLIKAEATF